MSSSASKEISLVGRTHALATVRGEIARAAHGTGGLLLVAGEAGIGKTALVTAAADEARAEGVLLLSGSCWDAAAAPGYWPWTQILRTLHRTEGERSWLDLGSHTRHQVEALLGDRRSDAGDETFMIFDAVTTTLVAAAQTRPVVVVLDDLHFADRASVELLEFVARHTWAERVLLIATYRDSEVDAEAHPLRDPVAALSARATTLALQGLDPHEVAQLVTRTAGVPPGEEVVAELHELTGGNPFFVEQATRLWSSGSALTTASPGVGAAVERRISLLPHRVADLLTDASVLGRRFSRKLLAAMSAMPDAQVDRLLERAVLARLVTSSGDGTFAFVHDLVRETLYSAVRGEAAADKHAAVVQAVDRDRALRDLLLPAELARHAYLGASRLGAEATVTLLLAAAGDANQRFAADEALDHLRRAEELSVNASTRTRVTCVLRLGEQLEHARATGDAWIRYDEAADLARAADDEDRDLSARVALTVVGASPPAGTQDRRLEMLVHALARLTGEPEQPVPLTRSERELLTMRVAEEYAGLARHSGDDDRLLFGLWATHNNLLAPTQAAERAALTDELIAVARRNADEETELFAASFRWVALLQQGDPSYLDQHRMFVRTAQQSSVRVLRLAALADEAIIASLCGDDATAGKCLERIADAASEGMRQLFGDLVTQVSWARMLLYGRFEHLAELLTASDLDARTRAVFEALAAAHQEDADRLPTLLDRVERQGPYGSQYHPLLLRLRAQSAALLADPERCAAAREELLPSSGHWLVSLYGSEISGPVELWLGVLDAAEGKSDSAIAHLTEAERSAEQLQARPWVLEARLRRALVLHASPADRAQAQELLRAVALEAEQLGMAHLLDRATRMLESAAAREDDHTGAEFRRDGSVWMLRFAGTTAHLPDTKGLRDLHLLLSLPGTDVSAVQLLDPDGGAEVVAAAGFGGDDVLDAEAKAQYRRRLTTLDEAIAEATDRGDDDTAAAMDHERDALLTELEAATGLAGRSRRLGDAAERARKTVSARIRDTLRKLDTEHPPLAAHLRSTISTGSSCRYQPDTAVDWHL